MKLEKKILFVTDAAFPPTSGSSVINSNLLKEFEPHMIVLAGEQSYRSNLSGWEKPKYPIHLFRHKFTYGRGSKYLQWIMLFRIKREILRLIDEYDIDVVFGIFPGEFYLYASMLAAKKKNIPLYSWFHNTYRDNRTGILKLIANILQPKIFKYSKRIFNMSEGMNTFMQERYPTYAHKMEPLLHGFDIPTISSTFNKNQKKERVDFLMSGNINHSNTDASQRLCKIVIENPNHHLHLYTGMSKSEFVAMGIKGENVHYSKFIPLKELVAKFPSFDIMLLPHGFEGNLTEAEYKTIFPTRTIPLLYSGKPILAHMPNDITITDFLEKYKCAEVVKVKSEDKIREAIEKLKANEEHCRSLVKNAVDTSRMFDAAVNANKIRNVLN